MTKADLIAAVATDADVKKSVVEKTLDVFMDTIAKALKQGDKITLTGFGTFQCSRRAARTGRNPKTGEEITISACTVPRFKPGNKLREALK
ncbi:MAG TPA: HU family DNA-binding protein [Syntrophorhabdales bacterium]|nr:HU family DNA-binding protein [Syntrophorhabdales bacterium]